MLNVKCFAHAFTYRSLAIFHCVLYSLSCHRHWRWRQLLLLELKVKLFAYVIHYHSSTGSCSIACTRHTHTLAQYMPDSLAIHRSDSFFFLHSPKVRMSTWLRSRALRQQWLPLCTRNAHTKYTNLWNIDFSAKKKSNSVEWGNNDFFYRKYLITGNRRKSACDCVTCILAKSPPKIKNPLAVPCIFGEMIKIAASKISRYIPRSKFKL